MKSARGLAVLCAGVAMLGACGQEKTVEASNAKPSEVAARMADADVKITPGAWETTIRTAEFSVEGMPPEMANMMKANMATAANRTSRSCLTPEQAAKPDGEFFGQGDKDCKYKDFSMGGGKISGTLVCTAEEGTNTTTLNGTYTSDSYSMDLSMKGNMGGKAMTMHMIANSHRVGDCTAQDKKA